MNTPQTPYTINGIIRRRLEKTVERADAAYHPGIICSAKEQDQNRRAHAARQYRNCRIRRNHDRHENPPPDT